MSWLDVSEVKEAGGFEPIPAGVYNLVVTDADETVTKTFNKRVRITFSVMDGQFAGRRIFEGYNITGSEKAVQIGMGMIKSLLKAANKPFTLSSPTDLIGIEVSASIKIKTDAEYGDKNTISSFKPRVVAKATDATPF